MKNETIKTYTLVASTAEALRLAEAGQTLTFSRDKKGILSLPHKLISIKVNANYPYEVATYGHFQHCYTVTELDPCQSPNGCPELAPWLAYMGFGKDIPESEGQYYMVDSRSQWVGGFDAPCSHYAIDVRTAWAQRNYPEHCRIRAYVAPCAIDVAWNAHSNGGACKFPREEHFRAGWEAAMSHAIANRREIRRLLDERANHHTADRPPAHRRGARIEKNL